MTTLLLVAVIIIFSVTLMIKRTNLGSGATITQIDSKALLDLKKNQTLQLIDVRTPGEFKGYHAPGFKNIPLNELSKRHSEINKNQMVVLMCASGNRSMQAASLLSKLEFTSIANFKGGISQFKG